MIKLIVLGQVTSKGVEAIREMGHFCLQRSPHGIGAVRTFSFSADGNQYATGLRKDDFHFSDGWLRGFKCHYDIQFLHDRQ